MKKIKIIAEIGINHNGDFDKACQMIKIAAQNKADFVKLQTFAPEKLYSKYTNSLLKDGSEDLSLGNPLDFFSNFVFSKKEYQKMFKLAQDLNVKFISSPFDINSVDLLEELGVEAYKVASSDANNFPLIEYLAQKKKEIFLATGLVSQNELNKSVKILKDHNCPFTLLHCVSLYPPKAEEANLQKIKNLKKIYHCEVGWSDHFAHNQAAFAAIGLGATVIEKHFKLNDDFPYPDGAVSITPSQLKELNNFAKFFTEAQGHGDFLLSEKEKEIAKSARRSIFVNKDLKVGDKIKPEDLILLRPEVGLSADYLEKVIGCEVCQPIKAESLLDKKMIILY